MVGEGEGGVSEAGSCRAWDRPATSVQATARAGSRRRHGATAAAGLRHAPTRRGARGCANAWGRGTAGDIFAQRATGSRRRGGREGGGRLPTRLISIGSADRSRSPPHHCAGDGRHSVALGKKHPTHLE